MRILLYYSDMDAFKETQAGLKAQGHDVSLRWANVFKEAHRDRCDAIYITSDVDAKDRERIARHYIEDCGVQVFTDEDEPEPMPIDDLSYEQIVEHINALKNDLAIFTERKEAIEEATRNAEAAKKAEVEAMKKAEAEAEAAKKAEAEAEAAKMAEAKAKKAKVKADKAKAEAATEKAEAVAAAEKAQQENAEAVAAAEAAEAAEAEAAEAEAEAEVYEKPSIASLRLELDLLEVPYTDNHTQEELQILLTTALEAE